MVDGAGLEPATSALRTQRSRWNLLSDITYSSLVVEWRRQQPTARGRGSLLCGGRETSQQRSGVSPCACAAVLVACALRGDSQSIASLARVHPSASESLYALQALDVVPA